MIDRTVQVGRNRITGEWGHNPFPGRVDSRECYCGRSDCIELYLSGPAVAAEYRRETGLEITTEQLMRRVAADAPARAILERYVARLARALAGVINILAPDVVVLGGGLSNIDELTKQSPDSGMNGSSPMA